MVGDFAVDKTLGFIGAGNMGGAIIHGLIDKKVRAPSHIWAGDMDADKLP